MPYYLLTKQQRQVHMHMHSSSSAPQDNQMSSATTPNSLETRKEHSPAILPRNDEETFPSFEILHCPYSRSSSQGSISLHDDSVVVEEVPATSPSDGGHDHDSPSLISSREPKDTSMGLADTGSSRRQVAPSIAEAWLHMGESSTITTGVPASVTATTTLATTVALNVPSGNPVRSRWGWPQSHSQRATRSHPARTKAGSTEKLGCSVKSRQIEVKPSRRPWRTQDSRTKDSFSHKKHNNNKITTNSNTNKDPQAPTRQARANNNKSGRTEYTRNDDIDKSGFGIVHHRVTLRVQPRTFIQDTLAASASASATRDQGRFTSATSSSTTTATYNMFGGGGQKAKKKDAAASSSASSSSSSSSCPWKEAVDPKSGKTYYYHTETRETQWRKPMELASASEQVAMQEKEQRQRDFFAAMEANILKNLAAPSPQSAKSEPTTSAATTSAATTSAAAAAAATTTTPQLMSKQEHNLADDESQLLGADARPNNLLIRTISSMDERILKDLVMRVPSHRRLSSSSSLLSSSSLMTSPDQVTTDGPPNTSGILPEEELLRGSNQSQTRPHALRQSAKQASLGTMLSTLPEEENNNSSINSINHLEFSFGEQSFHDMDEQESQALIHFAQVSSEMALMGDESFVWNNDDSFSAVPEGSESSDTPREEDHVPPQSQLQEEDKDDPLRHMSLEPTPVAGNKKNLSRGAASNRLLPSPAVARPKVSRRNTCGTLYVGSTMSAPDIDATIKCVCGVLRAHIVQSEMDPYARQDSFLIFNDHESQQRRPSLKSTHEKTPSLDQISVFYRDVFRKAQMESDCIIMSLIYVERLVKSTGGQLRPKASNWRSVLFSCMVLASKVWDDLSMWNGDFSQTCPAGVKFTLQRINELELAVLDALSYKVKVPASEYAKYYFLLRAMLIKSGLGSDAMKELNPLDVEGARRLQAVSSKYQRAASLRMIGNTTGPRSKSLTIEIESNNNSSDNDQSHRLTSNGNRPGLRPDPTLSPRGGKISLEHMVQM